jgi:hypothetical protein
MDTSEQPAGLPAESDTAETEPLYPGDRGELPEMARRVLVQLLIGPSLEASRHPRLWPALIQFQAVVESRLADLFLDLVMDAELGVAFTRQADTGELETPILLRRSPLTFLDSVLLLYLRGRLSEADARGEWAVVSDDDMAEQMKLYERSQNADRAGFEKRIRAAIEKAKKNSIISAIRGSEERYTVSHSLKLMFSAEEITALAQTYSACAVGAEEDADL